LASSAADAHQFHLIFGDFSRQLPHPPVSFSLSTLSISFFFFYLDLAISSFESLFGVFQLITGKFENVSEISSPSSLLGQISIVD
jgi:hypothetical protein